MAELIGAGWLFALVPALALARDRVLRRRRLLLLNRSLHELRRPLQALALVGETRSTAAPGFLDLALSALCELDRNVNGTSAARRRELVSCRELVVAAVGRWRSREDGLDLRLYWDAGPATVIAEPDRIARALDNLIANALEHGSAPLTLTATLVSGKVRITLSDAGPSEWPAATSDHRRRNGATAATPRRGHGLALVSEIAATHGGRFALSRSRRGSVAALELPVAGPEAAAAA